MDKSYEYRLRKAKQEYASKHRNCKNCIFYNLGVCKDKGGLLNKVNKF